ncbi:hypothetical protein WJX73_000051 [Symbiochloris irregularis]|uniref:DNA ligase IV n=1 Tax=Symbiochloris irregularis TaxID=706552 RepID=A0AAW1NRR1_9CHLO
MMDSGRRGSYYLKEFRLVSALLLAAQIEPNSSNGQRAKKWKDPETEHAGHFADVMHKYIFRQVCLKQASKKGEAYTMKVGRLNELLDQLAHEGKHEDKAIVLRRLTQLTTPLQMRFITLIILGDLKVGLTAKMVLSEYHPDAEHFYNMDMNLRNVIVALRDPSTRTKRKDLEVGKPANPQLSKACNDPAAAFKQMQGRPFVTETKLDGERIQLHRRDGRMWYMSRRAIDHGPRSLFNVMDEVVAQQVASAECILDGELIVWNRARQVFEPFGHLRIVISAIAEGQGPDSLPVTGEEDQQASAEEVKKRPVALQSQSSWREDPLQDPGNLEIVYVAFDILYINQQSVINLTLRERHSLLSEAIKPAPDDGIPMGDGTFRGRIIALTPGATLPSGAVASKNGDSLDDIQEMFAEAVRVEEEGIVIKALDSPWACNDRSSNWLKMKPDYAFGIEIDCLILGASYGEGRRSARESNGKIIVSEFLVALGVPAKPEGPIERFISFAKVASGLTDEEREQLSERLMPILRKNSGPGSEPKQCQVTRKAAARPDLWVTDPRKSVVLQVIGDARLIECRDFASRNSLRFPRITAVRFHDKDWSSITTEDELDKMKVQHSGPAQGDKKVRGSRESDVLKGCTLCFVSHGSRGKAALEGLVKRLGGELHQMWSPGVTHLIAATTSGHTWQAHEKAGHDIITLDWLLECESARRLVPLRPQHYLLLGSSRNGDKFDAFGDTYSTEIDASDMEVILNRHARLTTAKDSLQEYKHCPPRRGGSTESTSNLLGAADAPPWCRGGEIALSKVRMGLLLEKLQIVSSRVACASR